MLVHQRVACYNPQKRFVGCHMMPPFVCSWDLSLVSRSLKARCVRKKDFKVKLPQIKTSDTHIVYVYTYNFNGVQSLALKNKSDIYL